jgi:uncharacterized protein (UPF0335 family)
MNAAQLKQAGFSDDEISQHLKKTVLKQAGFSDDEISSHFSGAAKQKSTSRFLDEDYTDSGSGTGQRIVRQIPRAMSQGVADYARTQKGMEENRNIPAELEFIRKEGFSNETQMQRQERLQGRVAGIPDEVTMERQRSENVARLDKNIETMPKLLPGTSGRLEDAVVGVSRFLPAMGITAVSPAAGAAATFAQLFGPNYEEYVKQGHDKTKAFEVAAAEAMAEMPIEMLGNLLQIGAIKNMAKVFGSGKAGKLAAFGESLLKGAGGEGAEETVQVIPQEMAESYLKSEDPTIANAAIDVWNRKGEVGKKMLNQGATGALGGLLLAGAGGVALSPLQMPRVTAEMQQEIDNWNEAYRNLKQQNAVMPESQLFKMMLDDNQAVIDGLESEQEKANLVKSIREVARKISQEGYDSTTGREPEAYTKEDAAKAQAQKEAEYDELRRQKAMRHGDELAAEMEQERVRKLRHQKINPLVDPNLPVPTNVIYQPHVVGMRDPAIEQRQGQITGDGKRQIPWQDFQMAGENERYSPEFAEQTNRANRLALPAGQTFETGPVEPSKPLEKHTVKELKVIAKDLGIPLRHKRTKSNYIRLIKIEQAKRNAPEATAEGVTAPPPGAIAEPAPAAPPLRPETTPRSSGAGEATPKSVEMYHVGVSLKPGGKMKSDNNNLTWFSPTDFYGANKDGVPTTTIKIPREKLLIIEDGNGVPVDKIGSDVVRSTKNGSKAEVFKEAERRGYEAVQRGNDVSMRPETAEKYIVGEQTPESIAEKHGIVFDYMQEGNPKNPESKQMYMFHDPMTQEVLGGKEPHFSVADLADVPKALAEIRASRGLELLDNGTLGKVASAEVAGNQGPKSKIPTELESAIEIMKSEVSQGEVAKNELGHRVGSSYPKWFRDNKLTRRDFETVITKLEKGQVLTDKQFEVWNKIQDSAEEISRTHPDLVAESDIADMQKRGFEPVMGEMRVDDINEGDSILVKDGRGDDVLKHKGYDENGMITLKDGQTIKVDPWDTVDVEGIKRGGGLELNQEKYGKQGRKVEGGIKSTRSKKKLNEDTYFTTPSSRDTAQGGIPFENPRQPKLFKNEEGFIDVGGFAGISDKVKDKTVAMYETVKNLRLKPGGFTARTLASPEWGKHPVQQKIVDAAHNGRDEDKYNFFQSHESRRKNWARYGRVS